MIILRNYLYLLSPVGVNCGMLGNWNVPCGAEGIWRIASNAYLLLTLAKQGCQEIVFTVNKVT